MAKSASHKTQRNTEAEPVAKRERSAIMIYDVLREDILTLRLAPGEALDEVTLANRFGLSRTPVREALFTLSGENLVTFLANRTSIVTPHSMSNANDYFDTLTLLSRAVVRAAASTRTDADLDLLQQDLADLSAGAANADADAIEAADLKLRRRICEVARNFFYSRYYPSCIDFGRRMLRLHYFPAATPDDHARYLGHIGKVVDAIGTADASMADAQICQAINGLVQVIQRSLAPRGDGLIDLEKHAPLKLATRET